MSNHHPGSGEWKIQSAEYGLFFTKLLPFFITCFSFGFALPWAKCMVFDHWAKNVRIDGRRIRFTGNGSDLFGVWIKVFLLSFVTRSLYYWIIGYKAVARYIDSHLEWV